MTSGFQTSSDGCPAVEGAVRSFYDVGARSGFATRADRGSYVIVADKQDLVRIAHDIVAPHMPNEHAAIGERHLELRRELFGASMGE